MSALADRYDLKAERVSLGRVAAVTGCSPEQVQAAAAELRIDLARGTVDPEQADRLVARLRASCAGT